MDLKTSKEDMVLMMHLASVTLEDRARPDDSPFRSVLLFFVFLFNTSNFTFFGLSWQCGMLPSF